MVYLTAAAVLVADQATKLLADELLRPVHSIPLLGPYISLTWATNTGGAFGLLPQATGLLVVIAVLVVGATVLLAQRVVTGRLMAVGVACLLGGALGNLMDRLRVGYVMDFIDVHFWPIFNLADIAITVGAGLLIIATLGGAAHREITHEEDE
ncbi:MAG: signal peptidase II [Armatimonadota bacterium]